MSIDKEIKKMNLIIPSYEEYKNIKNLKSKKLKIKVVYKFSGFHFFIINDNNKLIYKLKRRIFTFKDKYVIYNPFDKEKGDLTPKDGKETTGYDIYLYKGNSFSIEKKVNNDNIDYIIDNLPIYFKGDPLGTNFEIIDNDTKKVIAKTNYYSNGAKGMTYDIEFMIDKYKIEILLGIICTKLLQINLMN